MTSHLHPSEKGWVSDPGLQPEEAGRVSDPPLQLLRCLKKTAIVLMLLFRLDKPVGESEIARILDLHPETTQIYLRSLARLGLVTRTHRYHGWTLTVGGRQMILGESNDGWNALEAGKIKTRAEVSPGKVKVLRSSAKVPPGKVKVCRSLVSRGFRLSKKRDRTAQGRPRSDPMVRANLEASASIGVMRNEFVLEICRMDHVSPDYIVGQKKRLEAERRYSHGLLLTVIRSDDHLPEKYLPREKLEPQLQLLENEQELDEEPDVIPEISTSSIQRVEAEASIHQPLSDSGMTAARAWAATLGQLKVDMPKAGYDKWVRDTVLLSAREGVFVIGAPNGYARDWLESRLSNTVKRFLSGVCNRSVEVKFFDLSEQSD